MFIYIYIYMYIHTHIHMYTKHGAAAPTPPTPPPAPGGGGGSPVCLCVFVCIYVYIYIYMGESLFERSTNREEENKNRSGHALNIRRPLALERGRDGSRIKAQTGQPPAQPTPPNFVDPPGDAARFSHRIAISLPKWASTPHPPGKGTKNRLTHLGRTKPRRVRLDWACQGRAGLISMTAIFDKAETNFC